MNNLIGLWINLSRAYEIALAGGFSIQVVFGGDYTQGFDDYEQIKRFFVGVPFVAKGDLVVEILKPDSYQPSQTQTLADIKTRVAAIGGKPTDFSNRACNEFLEVATQRLSFDLTTQQKVKLQLVRSPIGCKESHRATVRGLGLRKINSTSELLDTPEVRGMINKISYLVKVL